MSLGNVVAGDVDQYAVNFIVSDLLKCLILTDRVSNYHYIMLSAEMWRSEGVIDLNLFDFECLTDFQFNRLRVFLRDVLEVEI